MKVMLLQTLFQVIVFTDNPQVMSNMPVQELSPESGNRAVTSTANYVATLQMHSSTFKAFVKYSPSFPVWLGDFSVE